MFNFIHCIYCNLLDTYEDLHGEPAKEMRSSKCSKKTVCFLVLFIATIVLGALAFAGYYSISNSDSSAKNTGTLLHTQYVEY